jgi:hypothetical protein
MSGITLDDIANEGTMNPTKEFDSIPVQDYEEPSRKNEMFSRVMTAETGEGSIGDYLEHPMNFNNSKGLAQVIRGLTGITGNLNLAIVDVIFGALRFSKERKGKMTSDVLIRGGGSS